MDFRNKALGASAIGLLVVGAATGLSAQAILHPQENSAATAPSTAAHLVAPTSAPNYRAIVANNQGAVVGITTAGAMPASDAGDNPLSQFFGGIPGQGIPGQGMPGLPGHGMMHAQG